MRPEDSRHVSVAVVYVLVFLVGLVGVSAGVVGTLMIVERGPEGPRGEQGERGPKGKRGAGMEDVEWRLGEIESRLQGVEWTGIGDVDIYDIDSRIEMLESNLSELCYDLDIYYCY